MSLTSLFADKLAQHDLLRGEVSIAVAYSGGVDSHVLLHLCASLQKKHHNIKLKALHVNHGISEYSQTWQRHCSVVCKQLQVPFLWADLRVPELPRASFEATARALRYQALASMLGDADVLALGQHQQDQVETMLLQLKRGAGPKGLAAMAEHGVQQVPDSRLQYRFIRPLLHASKASIVEYARQQQLSWQDDGSNTDNRFDRNFLRNEVLTGLTTRWPGFCKAAARSARLCAEQQLLLDEQSDTVLKAMPATTLTATCRQLQALSLARLLHRGNWTAVNAMARFSLLTLNIPWLCSHSVAWQRQLLRRWIERYRQAILRLPVSQQICLAHVDGNNSLLHSELALPLPSESVLLRIQRELLNADSSNSGEVNHGNWQFRRYRDDLYLGPRPAAIESWQSSSVGDLLNEQSTADLSLPAAGGVVQMRLRAADNSVKRMSIVNHEQGLSVYLPKIYLARLTIDLGGLAKRFKVAGAIHSKPLKQWFKEYWYVPPWLRSRVPLLMWDEQILAVAHYFIADDAVFTGILDSAADTGGGQQIAQKRATELEWVVLRLDWCPVAALNIELTDPKH